MKIVFLYDSSEPESAALYEGSRAAADQGADEVVAFDVSQAPSAPCICCFQCWIKTPGKCVLPRDAGTAYVESLWNADYLVILTRIHWGGYSTRVKMYVDRLIPILHPYFTKLNGEMHHKFRYDSIPIYLAAGYGARSSDEENTFREYTASNRDQRGTVRETGTFIVERGRDARDFANACGEWLGKEIAK